MAESNHAVKGARLAALSLTALGVVYGDIGTSPLYALRECFLGEHPEPVTHANVLGILSLIFWALVIVVTLKYHVYVLKMDNKGEGGILALMSLLRPRRDPARGWRLAMVMLGIFGAALLYGDGMITPAISVLSAVEGLEVATPFFVPYVVPITAVILFLLFLVQRRGTASIGAVFGPIMVVWFGTIGFLGLVSVVHTPSVLAAVNPLHAVHFFVHYGVRGYLVLGAVLLVATGGEALYADLGHFGEKPIQIDWFSFVAPSLMLNYFGQGALLLREPSAVQNPFYRLAPAWGLYPLVILATVATVIASQAVISGAFSLTRQAVQLGYFPRMDIVHTSAVEIGQIYIPGVNWVLMLSTIALVFGFQRSTNMAAAYGVAVTSTMVITTFLAYQVARERFHWKVITALGVTAVFLTADLAFFGANIVKVPHGGWFPLLVAGIVFVLMTTWLRGRKILSERMMEGMLSMDLFLQDVGEHPPQRVPGTAVFLSGTLHRTPPALLHNLKHNKVLHRRVVLLTVVTEEQPRVGKDERIEVKELGEGFFRVVLRYGFMETSDVPKALKRIKFKGLEFPPAETTYFLGKETILATSRPGMAIWRERLFALMSRNARAATAFFNLPPNRVVELGSQVEI
ncbi:MAG: potassium transporter Kup [Acidobacteriota bacterium]